MPEPLFEIKNLVLNANNKAIISISNFEIHRGIIYAIMGQPGAGKTALLDLLAGVRKPNSGHLLYEGDALAGSGKQRFADEVCYLPQLPKNVGGRVQKYMLRNIHTADWTSEAPQERLEMIAKRMNLHVYFDRKMKTLSPGERRWIDWAICLATDTKALILDEFEQHLSYDGMEFIRRQIQRKVSHEGTTVILSTLSPLTMRRLSGVSVTLDRGRIAMIRSSRDGARPGSRERSSGGRSSGGSGPTGRGTGSGRNRGRPQGRGQNDPNGGSGQSARRSRGKGAADRGN